MTSMCGELAAEVHVRFMIKRPYC